MAQILGIPRDEAAELLRKGDTAFIRQAELSLETDSPGFYKTISRLKELQAIHPGAPFYAGLLINGNEVSGGGANSNGNVANGVGVANEVGDAFRLETLLFCSALESSSLPVQREAVLKLLYIILQNNSSNGADYISGVLDSGGLKSEFFPLLRAACLYRLGRYSEAAKLLPVEPVANFAMADSIVAESIVAESTPANLALAIPAEGDRIAEWEKAVAFFAAWKAPAEETLRAELRREISSFLFALGSGGLRDWAFAEALSSVGLLDAAESAALLGRRAGANYAVSVNFLRLALADGGSVFFSYPSLIADLGRAYQYTPASRGEGADLFCAWAAAEVDYPPEARYLILFYAGRIERAMGNYEASSDYFRRALAYTPDANQSDACIWYMLMNTLAESPAAAASLVKTSISLWNDLSYFDDVLERLSYYFARRRQWNDILEIYFSLESRGPGASLAQYAWIVGRAIEEGYIRSFYKPEGFFRTAFETENASFYYRAMAAAKLGLSVSVDEDPVVDKPTAPEVTGPEADFLLGFFEYGAASFALPYIQAAERRLSVPELREIAAALTASGSHKESLDLVSRYIDLEAPPANREDLLLYYPQPFKEMVESYAGEAGLAPEILYALIRTESYFKPDIVSSSGAVGLVQLMPATAAEMADRIARAGGSDYRSGLDLRDPEISIHIGSYYLAYLNAQMGSPLLALLAYNGGMGRVRNWLAADRRQGGLPEDLFLETIEYTETRDYGRKVIAAAAVYGYLYYGKGMEEVVRGIRE